MEVNLDERKSTSRKIANTCEAFTARSIAGMVGEIGLLTKAGLPYLAEVFLDFENRLNPRYRPVYRNIPFPNKPSASNPLYGDELERVRGIMSIASGIMTNHGEAWADQAQR